MKATLDHPENVDKPKSEDDLKNEEGLKKVDVLIWKELFLTPYCYRPYGYGYSL